MYQNDRPEELCEEGCRIPEHQHDTTVLAEPTTLSDAVLAAGYRRTVQVDGVMYCQVHDDFAIEGYDWSDVCHEQYQRGDEEDEPGYTPCVLVPMFVEVAPRHGTSDL